MKYFVDGAVPENAETTVWGIIFPAPSLRMVDAANTSFDTGADTVTGIPSFGENL